MSKFELFSVLEVDSQPHRGAHRLAAFEFLVGVALREPSTDPRLEIEPALIFVGRNTLMRTLAVELGVLADEREKDVHRGTSGHDPLFIDASGQKV